MSLVGIDPTETSVEQRFILGTRGSNNSEDGHKEYVYVKAADAVAVADFVTMDEGWEVDKTDAARATAFNCGHGAVVTPIAENSYGWVQVWGKSQVSVGGGFSSANSVYTSGTAGRLDDDEASQRQIIGIKAKTRTTTVIVDAFLFYPSTA